MKPIFMIVIGNAIWVGPNGKEYPIQMATSMSSGEALSFVRDFGSNEPDSCVYARDFKSGNPQPKPKPTGAVNSGKVN
jgi:hypothetical protein